jgi:hypothetical protein
MREMPETETVTVVQAPAMMIAEALPNTAEPAAPIPAVSEIEFALPVGVSVISRYFAGWKHYAGARELRDRFDFLR